MRMTTAAHFFETENHRTAFLKSILRGEVSLKFAYAGSAARTHDALARSPGYQHVTQAIEMECALIRDGMPDVGLTLLDVGSGNGDHALALLECLEEHGFQVQQLVLCDFSKELIHIAESRIQSQYPDLLIRRMSLDIEKGMFDLREVWSQSSILLLVGHTLGNPADPPGKSHHSFIMYF
jgi:L-histidine Nalpha-methyltransferase